MPKKNKAVGKEKAAPQPPTPNEAQGNGKGNDEAPSKSKCDFLWDRDAEVKFLKSLKIHKPWNAG
jgi:hypothetical protein